jgi:hypothetical protein
MEDERAFEIGATTAPLNLESWTDEWLLIFEKYAAFIKAIFL